MKMYKFIIPLLLSGCQLFPVKQDFPEVPKELMEPPAELLEIPNNSSADKVFDTVIDNYGLYHQLSDKYLKWQLWYENQKKIYNQTK